MTAKKNILLILKLPPPISGFRLMNKQVAESELLKESFNITILSLSWQIKSKYPLLKLIYQVSMFFRYVLKLTYLLITKKFDLVYFTISPKKWFNRDLLFVFILKLFRRKIVYHLHAKGIREAAQQNALKNRMYNYSFTNVDVICVSEKLFFDIENVYTKRPYAVPNGIKQTINENDLISRSLNNPVQILNISNLIRSKGIFDFVDALEILQKKNIPFIAYMAGKEYDITYSEIKTVLHDKSLTDKVKLLPGVYDDEKKNLLLESDIFVFPTCEDIWGLVLLEAMQAQLPLVSTYEGAIPEIIDDGINGYLVEKRNPAQLAEKIEYLINNPTIRKEMGVKGRQKFEEKYSCIRFEENLENTFNTILNKGVSL